MEATVGADQSKLQVIEDHDSEMNKILEEENNAFLDENELNKYINNLDNQWF